MTDIVVRFGGTPIVVSTGENTGLANAYAAAAAQALAATEEIATQLEGSVAAIASALQPGDPVSDLADTSDFVKMQTAERSRLASLAASVNYYETTDIGVLARRFVELDADNRIHPVYLEPETQSQIAAASQLTYFETTDLTVSPGVVLDGDMRVVLPGGLSASQQSNVLSLLTTAPATTWYETTNLTLGDGLLVDGDMRILNTGGSPGEANALLAASAGSRTSLPERLNQSITAYGMLKTWLRGEKYLKNFRIDSRAILRGQARQIVMATYMDSWGSNSYFAQAVSYDIGPAWNDGRGTSAALGWAGSGWCGFGGTTPKNSVVAFIVSASRTGTWANNFGTAIHSPDICSASSSTAGDEIAVTIAGAHPALSGLRLFALGGSGVVEYSWDNGSTWTSLTLTGTGGQNYDLGSVPGGTGARLLRIRVVSGAPELFGCWPRTTTTGVVMHMINATGTRTQQRAGADATSFARNMAALGLVKSTIFIGTPINDRNASRSPAEWIADITTIADRFRAIDPTNDLFMIMPPEVGGSNNVATPMSAFLAAAEPLIDGKRMTLLDFQLSAGRQVSDYAYANAYRPLLDAIDTHFGGDGVYLCQDAVFRALTKY